MSDLKNLIKEKANCSDEQAAKMVEVVSQFLKEKVPTSFHGEIDNLLAGKKLGDAFKQKLSEAVIDFRGKAEDVIQEVREKLSDLMGKK